MENLGKVVGVSVVALRAFNSYPAMCDCSAH